MKAIIKPSRISGHVDAPQSKSIAIRLLFSSLMGKIELKGLEFSDDVSAAARVVEKLGVRREGASYNSGTRPRDLGKLDVGGSGTVLRFLIPVLACNGIGAHLDGDSSLRRRPLNVLTEWLRSHGVEVSGNSLPLKLEGEINTGEIVISGSESSQYISGFIFGLLLKGGGRIKLLPPVRSESYIRMTLTLLNSLGANVRYSGDLINVEPLETPLQYVGPVPGDFLLSSFYALGAALTGGRVSIANLIRPEWSAGDSRIVGIIERSGPESLLLNDTWEVAAGKNIKPFSEDVLDSPDMAVPLAALASGSTGESGISGIELLKTKESNRVESITETLRNFGHHAHANDVLAMSGAKSPHPGKTRDWGDHRIAMLGTLLSLKSGGVVNGVETVNKSNPRFFDDMIKLGGDVKFE